MKESNCQGSTYGALIFVNLFSSFDSFFFFLTKWAFVAVTLLTPLADWVPESQSRARAPLGSGPGGAPPPVPAARAGPAGAFCLRLAEGPLSRTGLRNSTCARPEETGEMVGNGGERKRKGRNTVCGR